MDLQKLMQIIEPVLEHPLNDEQLKVVKHEDDPLWIVAGPGSGKTEVLVIRTLKLIFVNKIDPKSIIITTFTKKAAKNLFDRILRYTSHIFKENPGLEQQIDIHSLRIGTLHGLCNDIMLDYKTPEYENYRLLDENEQYLFIYEHPELARDNSGKYLPLWEKLEFLFSGFDPISKSRGWNDKTKLPNKWKRTDASISVFNRIVEDMIDIDKVKNAGNSWELLYEAYEDYSAKLEVNRRCDFAHLQSKFINFLESKLGSLFLKGNGSKNHPGIQYVMVDEYQDTNLIQEKIYFKLAENTHNLCVVGDDDQALYRFRGGTVDCMVTFNEACETYYGYQKSKIEPTFLNKNYRSHPSIVGYYDSYINSFSVMKQKGARVNDKPPLDPESGISGSYHSVAYITGDNIASVANKFSNFVKYLLDNNVITTPSKCALLMRSVRETPRNAGPFAQALRDVGIKPYNPRSRTFLDQEEIMIALGAFISIVDPELNALDAVRGNGIQRVVREWVSEYQNREDEFSELANYVNESIKNIKSKGKNIWLNVNILEIFYRILAHEPFSNWSDDAEKTYRLGKLSNIFETYSSIPYQNSHSNTRGNLRTSSSSAGEISFRWRQNFYYSLTGLLVSKGMNDPEDEAIICPPDRLPIMTVHQAKGLEFPFVFVYDLNRTPSPDSSILLENILADFRNKPPFVKFTENQRAEQDLIRFYYVAYSRPQYALIHLVTKSQIRGAGYGIIGNNRHMFTNIANDVSRD
ncbi:UvrD-helicase domain-containing protein [Methanosarcina sp. Mfa9]|uniref:UvrD-helicase domain-containing protein n=1 Tax=Methanosarcina sp. Mfa9 TaxID=3439063 RepID=UPI003F82A074